MVALVGVTVVLVVLALVGGVASSGVAPVVVVVVTVVVVVPAASGVVVLLLLVGGVVVLLVVASAAVVVVRSSVVPRPVPRLSHVPALVIAASSFLPAGPSIRPSFFSSLELNPFTQTFLNDSDEPLSTVGSLVGSFDEILVDFLQWVVFDSLFQLDIVLHTGGLSEVELEGRSFVVLHQEDRFTRDVMILMTKNDFLSQFKVFRVGQSAPQLSIPRNVHVILAQFIQPSFFFG